MRQQLIGVVGSPLPQRSRSCRFPDSVERLVRHLAAVTPSPVYYQTEGHPRREKVLPYLISKIVLSPSLFRTFVCTPGCTACCGRFTIDYTSEEFLSLSPLHKQLVSWTKRKVDINGVVREVYTFDQSHLLQCPYLSAPRPDGGVGCSLWPLSPLECAASPQLQIVPTVRGTTYIMKKPFSRAWAFAQKPQCVFHRKDDLHTRTSVLQDIKLLERYRHWAEYFTLYTHLSSVINMLEQILHGNGFLSSSLPLNIPTSPVVVWNQRK